MTANICDRHCCGHHFFCGRHCYGRHCCGHNCLPCGHHRHGLWPSLLWPSFFAAVIVMVCGRHCLWSLLLWPSFFVAVESPSLSWFVAVIAVTVIFVAVIVMVCDRHYCGRYCYGLWPTLPWLSLLWPSFFVAVIVMVCG